MNCHYVIYALNTQLEYQAVQRQGINYRIVCVALYKHSVCLKICFLFSFIYSFIPYIMIYAVTEIKKRCKPNASFPQDLFDKVTLYTFFLV